MGKEDLEFKCTKDIINFVKNGDYYVVREFGEEEKHYIEDWEKGDPKIIPISEDLFMDCYNEEASFRIEGFIENGICSLVYLGSDEE